MKRKNWSAPGADGIQIYWLKMLIATWDPLTKLFMELVEEPTKIVEWLRGWHDNSATEDRIVGLSF